MKNLPTKALSIRQPRFGANLMKFTMQILAVLGALITACFLATWAVFGHPETPMFIFLCTLTLVQILNAVLLIKLFALEAELVDAVENGGS